MNCSDAAERITALVDGELPEGERAALERHLEGCAACRDARAAEEAVSARLRAAPRPSLPPAFAAAVMDRVGAAPPPAAARPAGRLIPLWPFIAAGAAAAAGILAMVMVGTGERTGHFMAEGGPAAAPSVAAPADDAYGAAPPGKKEGASGDGEALPAEENGVRSGAARPSGGPSAENDRDPEGATGEAPVAAPEPSPSFGTGGGGKGAGDAAPPGVPAPIRSAKAAEPGGDKGPPEAKDDRGRWEEPKKKGEEALRDGVTKGEGKAGEDAKTPEAADREEESILRRSVFYRVDDLARGQQAVEGVLFSLKNLSYTRDPWVKAADLETDYGRLRRAAEESQAGRRGGRGAPPAGALSAGTTYAETRALPGEKVLQIRVRAADVDRLRSALSRDPGLTETHTQVLSGLLAGAPEDLVEELKRSVRENLDEGGSEATAGGGDRGAGSGPAREPGEPVPPPLPTKEQLRKLAEAPRKEQPAAAPATAEVRGDGGAGKSDEVLLEIHIFENPAAAPAPGKKPR